MAEEQPSPSYRALMTHVQYATPTRLIIDIRLYLHLFFSHQMHANCRALHEYTLQEKIKAARGEGPGFDGELNNFQAPQLGSLAKLVRILLFDLLQSSDGCCDQNMDDAFRLL